MVDARRFARFLDVHPEIDEIHHDLRVALRLVVAAHDAERHPGPPVFHDERGDQRVQRALVRCDLIRMARREIEQAAAIVQEDPRIAGDDARPEIREQRLNERHEVSFAVGDGHVDRIAAIEPGEVLVRLLARARRDTRNGAGLVASGGAHRVDVLAAQRGVLLRNERLQHGRRHRCRVGDVRRAIGERDPLRLDERVEIRRRLISHRLQVESLEDVQHLEDRRALGVRRELVHVVSAVPRRDRLDPVRRVLGEIALVEQPVALFHVRDNGAGDRTLVEGVAAAGGNRLERRRQVGVGEHLARPRRMASGKERGRRHRIGRELPLAVLPLSADDLGHRIAVLRVPNRRRHRLRHRDGAVLRQQLRPAFDDARNGDREHAGIRNARQVA